MNQITKDVLQVISTTDFNGIQLNIYGSKDEPLFRAKDIADLLEMKDAYYLTRSLDDDMKAPHIMGTLGGSQEVTMITEDGLYEALMLSRKEIAKPFKKYIREVLKEIRKTGAYIHTDGTESDEDLMARALIAAQRSIERKNQLIEQQRLQLESQSELIEAQQEDVTAMQSISTAINDLYIEEVAKMLSNKGCSIDNKPIGRNNLFNLLRCHNILNDDNLPYQRYLNSGYFRIKTNTYNTPGGYSRISYTTMMTGKGFEWLVKCFNKGSFNG